MKKIFAEKFVIASMLILIFISNVSAIEITEPPIIPVFESETGMIGFQNQYSANITVTLGNISRVLEANNSWLITVDPEIRLPVTITRQGENTGYISNPGPDNVILYDYSYDSEIFGRRAPIEIIESKGSLPFNCKWSIILNDEDL